MINISYNKKIEIKPEDEKILNIFWSIGRNIYTYYEFEPDEELIDKCIDLLEDNFCLFDLWLISKSEEDILQIRETEATTLFEKYAKVFLAEYAHAFSGMDIDKGHYNKKDYLYMKLEKWCNLWFEKVADAEKYLCNILEEMQEQITQEPEQEQEARIRKELNDKLHNLQDIATGLANGSLNPILARRIIERFDISEEPNKAIKGLPKVELSEMARIIKQLCEQKYKEILELLAKAPNTPTKKPQAKQPELPYIFHRERGKRALQRAIDKEMITQTETGYKWNGQKADFAYLVWKLSDEAEIPYKAIGNLFGISRLDTSINNVKYTKKPRPNIDELLAD